MNRVLAFGIAVGIACSVGACGDSEASADGSDGAAVAACRSVLAQVSKPELLATTVREEGQGFMVSAWRDGRADGKPDYLCEVVRDGSAQRGVDVVNVQRRDGAGAYRSAVDIEFDDDKQVRRPVQRRASSWPRQVLHVSLWQALAVSDRQRLVQFFTAGSSTPVRVRALAFVLVNNPEVVTLCGSMRFSAEHLAVHSRLSLAGCVVLLPALPVSDGETVARDLDVLAALHRRKIELSDRIHVVNPGNYIGPSTAQEIAYAEATGKRVTYEYGIAQLGCRVGRCDASGARAAYVQPVRWLWSKSSLLRLQIF